MKLAPDTQGIFDMMHEVSRELIGVVKEVPRLGPEDTEDGEELPTFYDVISDDEDAALKQIIAIDSGLGKIVDPVATFVARWEASYRHVWETDKDQFIARYRKAKKPLADFEADIERYQALLEQVTREDGVANLLFLRIDSAPLKSSLKSHCEEWKRRFTTLLLETADEELAALYRHFESNTKELVTAPTNLDELAAKVNVHKRIMETKEETHGRFAPLRAIYASLHRMDAPRPPSASPARRPRRQLDDLCQHALQDGGGPRRGERDVPGEAGQDRGQVRAGRRRPQGRVHGGGAEED